MSKKERKLKAIVKKQEDIFYILSVLFLVVPIFISPMIRITGFALSGILIIGPDHPQWFMPERVAESFSTGLNIVSIGLGILYVIKLINLEKKYVRIKNISVVKK